MISIEISSCNYAYNYNDELVGTGIVFVFDNKPDWVTLNEDGSFFFNALQTGTFVIDVFVYTFGPVLIDSGTITLTISDCTESFTPTCCDPEKQYNITWLSPEGGWRNYILTGKATDGVEQGKGSEYKDKNRIAKWSEVDDVYNSIVMTSGNIPKNHIDYTASMRYAIQAYLYDAVTGTWSIPIKINRESFRKYKRGEKFFEFEISFIYATQIIVQTQ